MYTIRHIHKYQEYEAVGRLQLETWGEEFIEMVPPAILLVTQKVGGLVAGAFTPEDELIGFVFGMRGHRGGEDVHWSHMLAVKTDWRGRGIGRALKQFQRNFVLDQNIYRIHWTYEPLETLNASLNMQKLGALPGEYVCDLYGNGESSALYRTIGTDRFIVTWYLEEKDRSSHLNRFEPVIDLLSASPVIDEGVGFSPSREDTSAISIEIPANIQQTKLEDPERARRWRKATRAAFMYYFERRYGVVQFVQDEPTGRYYYVMARPV